MHIHFYNFVFSTGCNRYFECRCGKRKVKLGTVGYSPIDYKWLGYENKNR